MLIDHSLREDIVRGSHEGLKKLETHGVIMSARPSWEESGCFVNDILFDETIVQDLKVGVKPYVL